jgi:hypothetical protein
VANRATRRQDGATYPSLDQWEHSKTLRGVRLPQVEGHPAFKVDFEIPDLTAFLVAGRIPNPLAAMAVRIETGGVKEQELSDEERKTYFDLQCYIIATHLRKPNLVEQLGEEDAVEWVKAKMHPDHRAALWQRAVHMISSDDIEEAIKSLQEAIPFRDGPGRDLVPADRADEEASA